MSQRRSAGLALTLLLGVGVLAWQRAWIDPLSHVLAPDAPRSDTVLFVVLDTVRADRTSVCGYERPTTPVLKGLAEQGWPLSCRAYTPGSWTLPTHASYFTGAQVPDHGAHSLASGGDELGQNTSEQVRALGPELPTLAEHFAAQGYDTLSVSGNPVVSQASGLTRGFETVAAPGRFGSWYGQDLITQLQHGLERGSHGDTPLFLFLNIADAHVPWSAVPDGLGWVPPRPGLDWGQGTLWVDFMTGRMPQVEQRALLEHLGDVYDYGVFRADRTLGMAMALLTDWNRLGPGARVVITSDHGEYLGEQGLLDHGHYLGDPNNQVFVLNDSVPVPEPVSAMVVHGLLRDGALPDPMPQIFAAAYPHAQRAEWTQGQRFTDTSAARWHAQGKVLWSAQGGWTAGGSDQDLVSWAEDPLLAPFVERVRGSGISTGEVDPDLLHALEAAGYMNR